MPDKSPIILATDREFELCVSYAARIEEIYPGALSRLYKFSQADEALYEAAQIAFGWPGARLKGMKSLKWVQIVSAGAERYLDRSLYYDADAVTLTTASGVYGLPIAEHMLAMILAFYRRLPHFFKQQAGRKWAGGPGPIDFSGNSLLVVGLGDIGGALARRAHALGARVSAIKRSAAGKPDYIEKFYPMEALDEALSQADCVALCLPLTDDTRGIIGRERLAHMKPTALLVNIGRGALVDQGALIEALGEGTIAGAALDVTNPEPLPADSPLWAMDNVIITPHVSGISHTDPERLIGIFIENLRRFKSGERLRNIVDFARGY